MALRFVSLEQGEKTQAQADGRRRWIVRSLASRFDHDEEGREVAYITHGQRPTHLNSRRGQNMNNDFTRILMRYQGTVCTRPPNSDDEYTVPINIDNVWLETGLVIVQFNLPAGLHPQYIQNLQYNVNIAIPRQLKIRDNKFVFGLHHLFFWTGSKQAFFAIRNHYHPLRPGHVRVDIPDGNNNDRATATIQPTINFRLLSDDEAKIVLMHLVDGIMYLEQTLGQDLGRRFFPKNVVISNGRVKFIVEDGHAFDFDDPALVRGLHVAIPNESFRRTVINFRCGQLSPPDNGDITIDRFQSPRYLQNPLPNDEHINPVDMCMMNCVLFVFELMTGGVSVWETQQRGDIKYEIFVVRRFLSTRPSITWEEVRNLPQYNDLDEFRRAADRIHAMSDGLKQLFEAVLLYRFGTWTISDVREWLRFITGNDDHGILNFERNLDLFPETQRERDLLQGDLIVDMNLDEDLRLVFQQPDQQRQPQPGGVPPQQDQQWQPQPGGVPPQQDQQQQPQPGGMPPQDQQQQPQPGGMPPQQDQQQQPQPGGMPPQQDYQQHQQQQQPGGMHPQQDQQQQPQPGDMPPQQDQQQQPQPGGVPPQQDQQQQPQPGGMPPQQDQQQQPQPGGVRGAAQDEDSVAEILLTLHLLAPERTE